MAVNVILLERKDANNNIFIYKPMNIKTGDYEEIDGIQVFKTTDGRIFQDIERLNYLVFDISLGVGYPISDEDLMKKYNETSLQNAKIKYLNDFEKNILYAYKKKKIEIKELDLNYINKESKDYIINVIDKLIKTNNLNDIKPRLIELKKEIKDDFKEKEPKSIEHNNSEQKLIEAPVETDIEKCAKEAIKLKEAIKKPLEKLNNLTGLEDIKEQVNALQATLLKDIKVKNFINIEPRYFNMLFTGNPGTGKTTVAEILAEILCDLGYLKTKKVTKIGSQDLIGKFVGHTADKTEKLLKDARGGVVIIDEAYTLASEGNTFRDDALGVLLKEMERPDTAFIFAGYEKEMDILIKANSGIFSRIQYHMHFRDYTKEELLQIFLNTVESANIDSKQENKLKVDKEALKMISDLIDKESQMENFGNARYIKNLYSLIYNLNSANTIDCYDIERILTIMPEDVPNQTMYVQNQLYEVKQKRKIGFITDKEKK